MKKIFALILIFSLIAPCAFSESPTGLERMSGFLNNFTELNLFNFDTNSEETDGEEEGILHLGNPFNTAELIRFGIRHNYIHNNSETVTRAPAANDYGNFVMEGRFVSDAVKKFFGMEIKNQSVLDTELSFYFDGKYYYFEPYDVFDDGETVYYADVKKITRTENIIELSGDIYNSQKFDDRPGTFEASAKISDDDIVITSITTDWRGDWRGNE